jgi:hypothetical protein
MAFRRKIGRLADTYLDYYLKNKSAEKQSDLVKQRQLEVNQQRLEEVAEQGRLNREQEMLRQLLGDPTGNIAGRLKRAGINVNGYDLDALIPPEEQIVGAIGADIQKANRPEDLPADLEALLAASGRPEMAKDPRHVERLQTTREAERAGILSGIKAGNRANAVPGPIKSMDPTGREQVEYLDPFQAADRGALPTERSAGQEASRAGQVAGAEARARQEAEWAPDIVEKKIDFEQRKRMAELATLGQRAEAELLATKGAAIKGLMPTYMEYRDLAKRVADSWAGAGGPSAQNVLSAIGKTPIVGSLFESGLEAGHSALTGIVDPDLARDIAELNRLRSTLAQGMANAVLGNRGQTTENDRRTAENILAGSFTDAETVEDLLAITDRMFGLAPTVAAQVLNANPDATPAEILTVVAEQVRAEKEAGTLPGLGDDPTKTPEKPKMGPAPTVPSIDEILSRPPRR